MKRYPYIYIILFGILLFSACERRALEDEYYVNAKIPIATDWSTSEITPQNVSVLFYDENNNGALVIEHRYEHNNKPIQSYVDLPVGKYTVAIFNEIRGQVKNVDVVGYDNISTLEFRAKEDDNPIKSRDEDKRYIHQPDYLGFKLIKGFEVTQQMLEYTRSKAASTKSDLSVRSEVEKLVGVEMVRKVSSFNITVHIKGLNNARMPALVDLRNISGGYLAELDKNCDQPVIHQFSLNNRKYIEGSSTEGTISTGDLPITLFGVVGERNSIGDQPAHAPILLDILFMLVDEEKTVINKVVDITDQIKFSEDASGNISLEIVVDVTEDPLPDVKPEGGGDDSGFGSSLEDWGVVDVPIINL